MAAVGATIVGYFTFEATQRSAEAAERAHIEDRLNKALDNLSNANNVVVRVGGVHQLVDLIHDSPGHQEKILDQLSIFVRDRAPLTACTKGHDPLPSDIQEALTAIGTNISPPPKDTLKYSVDLSRTCLRNADLSGLRFPRANFFNTNLEGANLSGADIEGGVLARANLDGIQFIQGDLTCTVLTAASIKSAMLFGVKLLGADLIATHFERSVVIEVDMTYANIEGATLSEEQLAGIKNPPTPPESYCTPPNQYSQMLGPY